MQEKILHNDNDKSNALNSMGISNINKSSPILLFSVNYGGRGGGIVSTPPPQGDILKTECKNVFWFWWNINCTNNRSNFKRTFVLTFFWTYRSFTLYSANEHNYLFNQTKIRVELAFWAPGELFFLILAEFGSFNQFSWG